jgi:hypothetical protein
MASVGRPAVAFLSIFLFLATGAVRNTRPNPERSFLTNEMKLLREAKDDLLVGIRTLKQHGPLLVKELYGDRIIIGNMPEKGITNRTVSPLLAMRDGLNADFNEQYNARREIERGLKIMVEEHKQSCFELRRVRNARVDEVRRETFHLSDGPSKPGALIEASSWHRKDVEHSAQLISNAPNSNERVRLSHPSYRYTLTNAKVQSLPGINPPPKPAKKELPRERMVKIFQHDLAAYKDESDLPLSLQKQHLEHINIALQGSCSKPPEIFAQVNRLIKDVTTIQNRTKSNLTLYNDQMDQLKQFSDTIDSIKAKRRKVMKDWEPENLRTTELQDSMRQILQDRDDVAEKISNERRREQVWNATKDFTAFRVRGAPACSKRCREELRVKIKLLTKEILHLNNARSVKLPLSKTNQSPDNFLIGACSTRGSRCNLCMADSICGWCQGENACMEGDRSGALFGRCNASNSTWHHISGKNGGCPKLPKNAGEGAGGIDVKEKHSGRNIQSLSKPDCQRYKYKLGQNHSMQTNSEEYPSGCFKMGGDFQNKKHQKRGGSIENRRKDDGVTKKGDHGADEVEALLHKDGADTETDGIDHNSKLIGKVFFNVRNSGKNCSSLYVCIQDRPRPLRKNAKADPSVDVSSKSLDLPRNLTYDPDHINTTLGNETKSKHWPTRRVNNGVPGIPVYLGAEDIGSNKHWMGVQGVRVATHSGLEPCAGFRGTPAECETAVRRYYYQYPRRNISLWEFLHGDSWSKKIRGQVSTETNDDDKVSLKGYPSSLNHHFQHESQSMLSNNASGGGVEDLVVDVGTHVDARWLGGCMFEEAEVTTVNPDGTFDLKYLSGRIEHQVLRDWLKPVGITGGDLCKAVGCIEVHGGKCQKEGKPFPAQKVGIQLTAKAPDSECKTDDDCDGEGYICAGSCESEECPKSCVPLHNRTASPVETNPFPEDVQAKMIDKALNRDDAKKSPDSNKMGERGINEPGRSALSVTNPNRRYVPRKDNPYAHPQNFPRKSLSYPNPQSCVGLFHDHCALNVKCCWTHPFPPKLGECRPVGNCAPPKGRFPHLESGNEENELLTTDPKLMSVATDALAGALDAISPEPLVRPINKDGLCRIDDDCFMGPSKSSTELYCGGDGHCYFRATNKLAAPEVVDVKPPPVVKVGTKCMSNGDCDEGLVCGLKSVCVEPSNVGEQCTVDAMCIGDLQCDPSGTCTNFGGLDAKCSIDKDCVYGMVCDNQTHVCKGDIGALCNSTQDCAAGRLCSNGRIFPRGLSDIAQRNQFAQRRVALGPEAALRVTNVDTKIDSNRYIDNTAQYRTKGNIITQGRFRKEDDDMVSDNKHVEAGLHVSNRNTGALLPDEVTPSTATKTLEDSASSAAALIETGIKSAVTMRSQWCGETCRKKRRKWLLHVYRPFFTWVRPKMESCIKNPFLTVSQLVIPQEYCIIFEHISGGRAMGGAPDGRAGLLGIRGSQCRFDPRDEPEAVRNSCRMVKNQYNLFVKGTFDMQKLEQGQMEATKELQGDVDREFDARAKDISGEALGLNGDGKFGEKKDVFHLSHCIWRAGEDPNVASKKCCPCPAAASMLNVFLESEEVPADISATKHQWKPTENDGDGGSKKHQRLLTQWGDKFFQWVKQTTSDVKDAPSVMEDLQKKDKKVPMTPASKPTQKDKTSPTAKPKISSSSPSQNQKTFPGKKQEEKGDAPQCCRCKTVKDDIDNWSKKYVYRRYNQHWSPELNRDQCKDGALSINCLRQKMRDLKVSFAKNETERTGQMMRDGDIRTPAFEFTKTNMHDKRLQYSDEKNSP